MNDTRRAAPSDTPQAPPAPRAASGRSRHARFAVNGVDPVERLYSAANGLLHLAQTLPEDQNGLAHLLWAMGE